MSQHLLAVRRARVAHRVCCAVTELLESRQLLSAGQLDPTFGTGGVAYGPLVPSSSSPTIMATAVQGDGKVVAAGTYDPAPMRAQPGEFAVGRYNRDGTVDRTFGSDGRVTTAFPSAFDASATAMALQPDGKIVVAGDLTFDTITIIQTPYGPVENYTAAVALVRYLPSGQLDRTFGRGGIAQLDSLGNLQTTSLVIQHDGKYLIGGTAQDATASVHSFAVARVTTAGVLDKGFGQGGVATTDFSVATGGGADSQLGTLLLQRNGDIVAAGFTSPPRPTGNIFFAAARYRPDGSLDRNFGSRGLEVATGLRLSDTDLARVGAALQPDGKIVLAGERADGNAMTLLRLTPSGAVDSSFGSRGFADLPAESDPTDSFRGAAYFTVLVQADSRIVAVATHEPVPSIPNPMVGPNAFNGTHTFLLARFTARGALDPTFGQGGTAETPFRDGGGSAGAAALQSDGKIIVAGGPGDNTSVNSGDFTIARYTSNGLLDTTFGHDGATWRPNGLTGTINAVAVQRDGKVVVAGYEVPPDPASQPTDAALVRYNANGSLDTTFGKDGHVFLHVGSDAEFNALVVEANGDIVAGGYAHGSIDHFLLARYLPSGAPDLTFGTGGQVVTGFDYRVGERCTALAVESDGDIVAVGSTPSVEPADSPPHGGEIAVARYLPNGKIDMRFAGVGKYLLDPLGRGAQAAGVAVLPDSSVLIGASLYPDLGVIRVRPDGFIDRTFGTNGVAASAFTYFTGESVFAQAAAMTVDSRGRIVVGGAISAAGLPGTPSDGFALSRFLPNGRLDRTFGTGGNLIAPGPQSSDTGEVLSLVVQRDGRIVAGTTLGTARFTDTGLDTTFGTAGLGVTVPPQFNEPAVNSVALQPDGKILAAGLELYRWTAR